jgi:hypothetical protein
MKRYKRWDPLSPEEQRAVIEEVAQHKYARINMFASMGEEKLAQLQLGPELMALVKARRGQMAEENRERIMAAVREPLK